MQRKELGKTGEKIPALGIGTWRMGKDTRREIEAIRYAIENDMNFIDTAEMYGTGAEVGEAVKGHDDVFIATKVSPYNFHYDDVMRSCSASLSKLGVRSIDLYQLHWPNSKVPIEETMRAMEELQKQGKIRHIGVSNFSVEELEEAQSALKGSEIVSDQVEYSMLVRDVEEGLMQYCERERITIIAYSPLARGHILEKKRLVEMLGEVGRRHGKTPVQVALNWLISKGRVVAIPKASSVEHVKELIGASDWRLSEEEMRAINDFLSR